MAQDATMPCEYCGRWVERPLDNTRLLFNSGIPTSAIVCGTCSLIVDLGNEVRAAELRGETLQKPSDMFVTMFHLLNLKHAQIV